MTDPKNSKYYDIAIVGAGVTGLWLAHRLAREDVSVILLDENAGRSAASYGLLGALLPHMPTGWNAKKQFQFEALTALPGRIADLENQTGLQTGYRQCGRIMPVRRAGFLRQTKAFARHHNNVWHQNGELMARYELAPARSFDRWLPSALAPLGIAHETLSARINPRQLVTALRKAVAGAEKIDQLDDFLFHHFDMASHQIHGTRHPGQLRERQQTIQARKLVITAGYKSFPLLAPLSGLSGTGLADLGTGVKGQVALLKTDMDMEKMPILYDNGLYIVPHESGMCAVGSTAEKQWQDAATTDSQLDDLIERARTLCPALHTAVTQEKWAGIRPRCHAKDPLVGKVPGMPVYLATGGFKITFGIAHKMADILVDILQAKSPPPSMPPSFTMEYHLEQAEKR